MTKIRSTIFVLVLIVLVGFGYIFYQVKNCTPYTPTEVGLTHPPFKKGKTVKVCFAHLIFKSLASGIPYKIKIYKDGYFIKNQFLSFNFTDNVIDDKQHDYIIEIIGTGKKRTLLSSAAVLFGAIEENVVKVNWVGGRPVPHDIYSYINVVGLEKIKYAVSKNPFEGTSEVGSVHIFVLAKSMDIVSLTIYAKDKNIAPRVYTNLKNPYLLIKYDAAFNANSFLWDDAFTSWFSINQNPEIVKNTLDFWYSLQIKDGENKGLIPREVRTTNYINSTDKGVLLNEINPISIHPLTSNQLTGPYILSRVEIELYKKTHDVGRLKKVIGYNINYFNWIENHRKENKFISRVNGDCPIYKSSNFGSGMDNLPRAAEGWFDLAAQQVALAGDISEIAKITKDNGVYQKFSKVHETLKEAVQTCYFDTNQSFWFDILPNGNLDANNPTAAGLWGIYASLATKQQLAKVIDNWITNPQKFGGFPPIPSLPRDHPLFNNDGEYWMGGAWPPMWWITIYGLKENNYKAQAGRIFSDVIKTVSQTFQKEGTVFEFYSPTVGADGMARQGKFNGYYARADLLGWGKLPLMYSEFIYH